MKNILLSFCFILAALGCGNKAIEDGFARNDVVTISAGWVAAFAVPISEEQVILVDTGGQEDAESVMTGLQTLGYTTDQVSHIFLTHGHQDHVDGFDKFEDALIVGFAEDEPAIEEWLGKSLTMDIALSDGDKIDVGGTEIEAFHLPGHTQGNAAFLVNRVMLMGSTAYGKEDGTLSEPPGFFSDDAEAVKNQIKALWARLEERQEDVEWLFFAHTGAHEGLESLEAYDQ